MKTDIWIAAQYRFISCYSLREPGTSTSMARVLPAPGPSTVRLALIYQGIKLIGVNQTRELIFPIVKSIDIKIQPPEQVGITLQPMRGYIDIEKQGKKRGSIMFREYAYASSPMTIFIHAPDHSVKILSLLLSGIRYWGQSESLALCQKIEVREPDPKIIIYPLNAINKKDIGYRYCCFVTEFKDSTVNWDSIVGTISKKHTPIIKNLFIWPLEEIKRWGNNKLLSIRPFPI